MDASGRAEVFRASACATGGIVIVRDLILCCGGVSCVCEAPSNVGSAQDLVVAECDASGERGWLVLRTAAALLKPVPQARSHMRPRCTFLLNVECPLTIVILCRRASPGVYLVCL
jgi:hypothetical protein